MLSGHQAMLFTFAKYKPMVNSSINKGKSIINLKKTKVVSTTLKSWMLSPATNGKKSSKRVYTTAPKPSNLANGAWSVTPPEVGAKKNTFLDYFHASSLVSAVGVPLGLLLSSTPAAVPIEAALAVVLPFHAYYGVHHVIEDYVPYAFQSGSNILLAVVSILSVAGLLDLALRKDGIFNTIKSLWAAPEQPKDKK